MSKNPINEASDLIDDLGNFALKHLPGTVVAEINRRGEQALEALRANGASEPEIENFKIHIAAMVSSVDNLRNFLDDVSHLSRIVQEHNKEGENAGNEAGGR